MALTYTPTGALGSKRPEFTLPTVENQQWNSQTLASAHVSIILFICNHCPYVQAIESRLLDLVRALSGKPVQFVGICSNDWQDHPEDSPSELRKRWQELRYGFPYLVDEQQTVAKAFGAVCTPDIFVYDHSGMLRYRGRFDDSWRNAALVKRQELKLAIEALLAQRQVPEPQVPSMGCSIKWKNP